MHAVNHAHRSPALLATAMLALPGGAWGAAPGAEFRGRFPAESIARFDLELPAGNVQIRAVEPLGLVTVDAQPIAWSDGCSVDIGQDAERAWARVASANPVRSCRADVAITLGVDTVIVLKVGQGDVKISNLDGALTADIGAGDLVLEAMRGPLDVEMGNGQLEGTFAGPRLRAELGSGGVHLQDLGGPADVELGMGNVDLSYSEAPVGRVDARTGTGSIRILMPPETPVDAELTLGIGSKRLQLPQVADAPTHIDATAGVGRILVAASATEPVE